MSTSTVEGSRTMSVFFKPDASFACGPTYFFGNNAFLLGDISADFKDLHAVKERCWDYVKVVG
jgi:hypothetical protein